MTLLPKLSVPPAPVTGSCTEVKSWPQPCPKLWGASSWKLIREEEGRKTRVHSPSSHSPVHCSQHASLLQSPLCSLNPPLFAGTTQQCTCKRETKSRSRLHECSLLCLLILTDETDDHDEPRKSTRVTRVYEPREYGKGEGLSLLCLCCTVQDSLLLVNSPGSWFHEVSSHTGNVHMPRSCE